MALLKTATVMDADSGMRLDRWFKVHYPALGHGALQKLLRTGQVRVDGGRVKANLRLDAGMEVRVPPAALAIPEKFRENPDPRPVVSVREADDLRASVLYRDDHMIVVNKPAGLAVQGGTGTRRHLDGMLDELRFGSDERPRLVHRLDKDTSGVLVLARSRKAAQVLTRSFHEHETRKLYWAITAGSPKPRRGRISLALAKSGGPGSEKMQPDGEDARHAVTLYDTLDEAGNRAALVALMPLTGRTHQLRAHMAAIGSPILGDGKYGGREAFIEGPDLEKRLHLHARALEIPKPGGGILRVVAPLPDHLSRAIKSFGFIVTDEGDPFPRE